MKIIFKETTGLFSVCSLLIFLISCQSNEDLREKEPLVTAKTDNDAPSQTNTQTVELQIKRKEPSKTIPVTQNASGNIGELAATDSAPILAPGLAPVLPPVLAPVPMPWVRPLSIFDDGIDVDPWLANYVGSYGVLPSRIQDDGPFLYSFDVSPEDVADDDDLNILDDDNRQIIEDDGDDDGDDEF